MKQQDATREKLMDMRESNRELRNRCLPGQAFYTGACVDSAHMQQNSIISCRVITQDKQLALAKRTIERLSFERITMEVRIPYNHGFVMQQL